jgi:hypothetical protein
MNGSCAVIPIFTVLFTVSCATTVPETHEGYETEPVEVSSLTPQTVASDTELEDSTFDSTHITPEMYVEIKEDIIGFIHELNAIIRSKDYKSWREHLDDDYYNYISSPGYLEMVSNTDVIRKNGVVLTSADAYFTYVVVPSRYRDRVDDIEITGVNRVKVITVDKGVRLRLYDLEKTKSGWKIVMPISVNS